MDIDFSVILELGAKTIPVLKLVLEGLGSLVIAGWAYVLITPSKKDDAWLQSLEGKAIVGPLLKALKAFSPIQRKGE